jgi:aryl-alcohol dehydrogenase-like predicted oxidoreductase
MGTDYVDLFQLHSPPLDIVARGEWAETLNALKREGKVRYYGISCDSVDIGLAALDQPGISSIQVVINLLERGAVGELLPGAKGLGVGVIARECLANGLLAKDPATIDVGAYCQTADEAERKAVQLEMYRRVAQQAGLGLAHLAMQYVSALSGVSVSLIGASRVEQIEALVSAGSLSGGRKTIRGGIPNVA